MYSYYKYIDCSQFHGAHSCLWMSQGGWQRAIEFHKEDFKKIFSRRDMWNDPEVNVTFDYDGICIHCNLDRVHNMQLDKALLLAEEIIGDYYQPINEEFQLNIRVYTN